MYLYTKWNNFKLNNKNLTLSKVQFQIFNFQFWILSSRNDDFKLENYNQYHLFKHEHLIFLN